MLTSETITLDDLARYEEVERLESVRSNGELYGYPTCCVKSFISDMVDFSRLTDPSRLERKLIGTGYIPCSECDNNYSEEELIAIINESRDKGLTPFHLNI